jgi:hypothetical protein
LDFNGNPDNWHNYFISLLNEKTIYAMKKTKEKKSKIIKEIIGRNKKNDEKKHVVKIVKDVLDAEDNLDENILGEEFQEDVEPLFDDLDAIEVEDDNAEKITFGMGFNPKDGDLGDETEDLGDLPDSMRKNRFDNTLSAQPTGDMDDTDDDELVKKIRVTKNKDSIGLGYGDNDYSKEE